MKSYNLLSFIFFALTFFYFGCLILTPEKIPFNPLDYILLAFSRPSGPAGVRRHLLAVRPDLHRPSARRELVRDLEASRGLFRHTAILGK